MQIFNEIKARGVEDISFISMDGVSGLEEGTKSIQLKKIYGAVSLKAATAEFERFKEAWKHYPRAIGVWERNWVYVE